MSSKTFINTVVKVISEFTHKFGSDAVLHAGLTVFDVVATELFNTGLASLPRDAVPTMPYMA